jgi:hypothetical protein
MVGRCALNEIGLVPILKVESDVLHEPLLIPFDGEVIVGLASHYVAGNFPLGEKGVGGDVPALNVDGIKEGGRGGDLVRLFELVIEPSRKCAYFF